MNKLHQILLKGGRKMAKRGWYDKETLVKLLDAVPIDLQEKSKKKFWKEKFSFQAWFSIEDVASAVGLSRYSIKRMASDGQIRSHFLKNKRINRFYRDELAEDFFKLDTKIAKEVLKENE